MCTYCGDHKHIAAQGNSSGQTSGAQAQGSGGDTIPGASSTTFTLAVGGSATGVINSVGDRDWFRIDLTAGEQIRVALNGIAVPGSAALSDPYLRIYNSQGIEVDFDDDGGPGTNSLMTFTATSTGAYYIAAGAYNDGGMGGVSGAGHRSTACTNGYS